MLVFVIGSCLITGAYRLGLKKAQTPDTINVNDIVGVYEYENGDFYIEVINTEINEECPDEILVYEFEK